MRGLRKKCGGWLDGGKDAEDMRRIGRWRERCGGWLDGGKDAEDMRRIGRWRERYGDVENA